MNIEAKSYFVQVLPLHGKLEHIHTYTRTHSVPSKNCARTSIYLSKGRRFCCSCLALCEIRRKYTGKEMNSRHGPPRVVSTCSKQAHTQAAVLGLSEEQRLPLVLYTLLTPLESSNIPTAYTLSTYLLYSQCGIEPPVHSGMIVVIETGQDAFKGKKSTLLLSSIRAQKKRQIMPFLRPLRPPPEDLEI